ncbi:MAG TPA: hypothetical protein PKV93_01160 [Fervidobacterium sp.]|nr:hypothetical protein [Fervidobacterium sp.]
MFKKAEERQAYELGKIFGYGLAEGYLEKIAEELEQVQQQLAEVAEAFEDIDTPDFEYESTDEDPEVQQTMELREALLDMTPEEVVAWYNSLDEGTRQMVDNIPEIAIIVEQAHAQFTSNQ